MTSVEWLNPDVVITDCPQVVKATREMLRGEQILFVPDPADNCRGDAQARREADDVLDGDPAHELDARRLQQRLSRPRSEKRSTHS